MSYSFYFVKKEKGFIKMAVFRIKKNKKLYCNVKSSFKKHKFVFKGKGTFIAYAFTSRRMGLYNKRSVCNM